MMRFPSRYALCSIQLSLSFIAYYVYYVKKTVIERVLSFVRKECEHTKVDMGTVMKCE